MTDYRLRTLAAGFFAVALAGSVLTGCKRGASNNTFDNGVDSLTWCTVSFEDSVSVLDASAYQQMAADFPIDVDTAVMDAGTRAAIEWVANTLQSCSYPDYDGSGREDKLMPVPAMDEAELETFVARCGKIGLDSMKADMREMAEDGFGGSYLNNIKIELTEQTPSYLTLTFGHEVYTGGAHGGWITNGATFSRATGEQMGWNLFDMSKEQELRAMLIRGVKSYFNDFSEEKIETDEQLYELLILYDDPETPENEITIGLPFPQAEPYVTRDGISFVYQQYEIAAYACGLPSFIVPVEEVKDLLSEKGKELLGISK